MTSLQELGPPAFPSATDGDNKEHAERWENMRLLSGRLFELETDEFFPAAGSSISVLPLVEGAAGVEVERRCPNAEGAREVSGEGWRPLHAASGPRERALATGGSSPA